MTSPDSIVYLQSRDTPEGRFVPMRHAAVCPDDRGFVFADAIYEVVRAYGGCLYRFDEHMARLVASLAAVRIPFGDVSGLAEIALELLRHNHLERGDATVYLQVTRGAYPRAHAFPKEPLQPTLYAAASPLSPRTAEQEQGIAAITAPDERWARCDVKSTNLLANVLAMQQAVEAGGKEALLVRDGVVTEGTHSNVFGVREGVLYTHPATARILAGVTRGVVLRLAASAGVRVVEEPLSADGLAGLDELLITGTVSEVTPVVQVDGKPVGAGLPGAVTRSLQQAMRHDIAAECEHAEERG